MSRTKTVGRQEINAEKKRSQLLEIWRRLKKNKVAVVGLVILGVLLCVAIFADVIVDYDLGIRQNMAIKLQKPSAEHWLGTDAYGRDLFARIVHGSRISLSIGFIAVLVSLLIGGAIGSIAGYYGGKADIVIMRFVDILMAIPSTLMCICVVHGAWPRHGKSYDCSDDKFCCHFLRDHPLVDSDDQKCGLYRGCTGNRRQHFPHYCPPHHPQYDGTDYGSGNAQHR